MKPATSISTKKAELTITLPWSNFFIETHKRGYLSGSLSSKFGLFDLDFDFFFLGFFNFRKGDLQHPFVEFCFDLIRFYPRRKAE